MKLTIIALIFSGLVAIWETISLILYLLQQRNKSNNKAVKMP